MKMAPSIPKIIQYLSLTVSVFILIACGGETSKAVSSEDGILDLRDLDIQTAGAINLDGEWRFIWKTDLESGQTLDSVISKIDVPHSWNGHRIGETKLAGQGYGSYFITILLPSQLHHYALAIPTTGTAYDLFVNDELLGGVGICSDDPNLARAEYKPMVYDLGAQSKQLTVRIDVSNHDHRLGGLWESPSIGTISSMYDQREDRVAMELFMFGTLFIMGVYHLGIFSLSTRGKGALYFGLFCLLISLRTLVTGQIFLLEIWSSISWRSLVRIEYLTFYLGIPIFYQFISIQFPYEMSKKVGLATWGFSGLFSLMVIFTAPLFFSGTLIYFQLLSFALMLYVVYALGLALIRGEEGSGMVLFGFLIIMLSFLNDVLNAGNFIQTGYLVSLGLMVFILTQALLISLRFSKAYSTIDSQRIKLERTNVAYQSEIETRQSAEKEVLRHKENLEELVEARTEELQIANDRLKALSRVDGLTGIANRRRMDEALESEWRRMGRQEKHLSVIMCDIDHFKLYNDTYGHQRGDDCLTRVAKAIKNSINRPADLVARYGGEEFCVILPETTQEGAAILAEIIRENVKYLQLQHESSPVSKLVTLSLGVAAVIPDKNSKPVLLLEAADRALYQAKGNGRDRVEVNLPEKG